MVRQGTTVNHNIVEVHNDDFAFHWLHDAIHHAHELTGCFRQAKRQESPLIPTKFSGGGRLLSVGCCNTEVMVTSRTSNIVNQQELGVFHGSGYE